MKKLFLLLTVCTSFASDLFTNGPVKTIRIEIGEAARESLKASPRAYVPAEVIENSRRYESVAVHLKGSSTFEDIDRRPSFTLHFSKLEQGLRFHGLRKIHLNNSKQDQSLLTEQLCGELFRSVGVPAPRATHARLILNGRDLGVYVLKEGFEKEFLARHFQNTKGNIYEGGRDGFEVQIAKLLQFFVSGQGYTSDFDKLTEPGAEGSALWSKLQAHFELKNLTSFLAMESIAGCDDGYGQSANNYKIYKDASSRKLFFLAHGQDVAFLSAALYPDVGAAARSLMAINEGRALYEKRLREIFANQFQLGPLTNRVLELARPVRVEIERVEGKDAANIYDGHVDHLVQRIANRWHEVDRELTSDGE
jgi:spore coat protein H